MNSTIVLPQSLLAQIRGYEARLKRMETWWAVAGGFAGLFFTLVLLYGLDRLVDTPKWGRLLLLTAGVAGAAYFAKHWAKHWVLKKRQPAELAKMLGKHFRGLGDRLQGVVEIANSKDLPPNVSEALCRAAIAQVAEESKNHQFETAVPTRPTLRWAYAGLAVAGMLGLGFVATKRAAKNALERWSQPLADVERYTFASLEKLPAELVVAHGEPFELALSLQADSEWRPEIASAQIERQDEIFRSLDGGKTIISFPGQTKDGTIKIRVGDARKSLTVKPLHRPELQSLKAQVALPEYLQLPEADAKVSGSGTEFLSGSWVSFAGEIARELGSASMTAPGTERGVFREGKKFTTQSRLADELEGSVTFTWADQYGIAPQRPYQLKITTIADAEPKVELRNLDPEVALLPNEVLNLDMLATDDFGIKETWLEWTLFAANGEKKVVGQGEALRMKGAPNGKEIQGSLDWSPAAHKIPEDTLVELAARAVDYFPGRTACTSFKHTILVMSPAKHAERIRDRMDAALKGLDDRIRDEESNMDQNKKMTEAKEQLGSEKAAEKIKEMAAEEQKNQEQLAKSTEEMENILDEALRNKEVPAETLAEWKKLTEQLKQKANPAMQKAQQQMQEAAQKPQASEQEKDLAEAKEEQQEALDAMKEAAQKMDKVSENLFAKNFYNRLKRASQQENQVADSVKRLAMETAGLLPEEIDAKSKKLFDSSAQQQDEAVKNVDEIQKDMSVFVTRLPNEKYSKVLKEIEDKKALALLTELAGYVRANLGLKSVGQARAWGKQLDAWAEMLRDPAESQEGKPKEPQEMPPEMMELLIAMVRAAQQQDAIREQTLAVDKLKWESLNTLPDVNHLADQQAELADSLHQLMVKTPIEEAKPLLGKVENFMSTATSQLRAAMTEKETTGLQSAIVELLVPPDKKNDSKQSKPKPSPMAKMQQMARQMMAKGNKPGRSTQKGGGDLAVEGAQGVAIKDKQNMRTVEKGGGASGAGEWPAEFRDALQQYFNRVETELR